VGAAIPNLPPYDPTLDEKFPWEESLAAAVERLESERAAAPSGDEVEPGGDRLFGD
jgi:hypothetical protein